MRRVAEATKLRICHLAIVHNVFCDARIMAKMAHSAAGNGHHVSIITSNTTDRVVGGVEVVGISRTPIARLKIPFSFYRVYREALRINANVYHIHEVPLMLVGLALRWIHGRSVIVDFHEDFEEELLDKEYLPLVFRLLLRLLFRIFKRTCVPSFAGVILAEDSYETKFGGIAFREVIRNYPICEKIVFDPVSAESPEVIKICYVGTISEDRGCFDLIEAARLLLKDGKSRYKIDLIGPVNSDGLERQILDRIEQYGISEGVTLVGRKTYEDVCELLTKYHIGFSALHGKENYKYSLPTKILEYNLAGLPCIVSDLPISYKYVVPGVTGAIVEPGNSKEIARSIQDLVSPWSKYLENREACRDHIVENYSWSREYRRLEHFYFRSGNLA